jgi:hypothetical protein
MGMYLCTYVSTCTRRQNIPYVCSSCWHLKTMRDLFFSIFLKRLPGVGSESGSSRFHLFSHFSPLYCWATAAPRFFYLIFSPKSVLDYTSYHCSPSARWSYVSGLPDDLVHSKIPIFKYKLEGLEWKTLVYFMAIWYSWRPFCIWCGHFVYFTQCCTNANLTPWNICWNIIRKVLCSRK